MTNEQINIAIAEHCGWEFTNVNPKYGVQDIKFWYNAKENKIIYWSNNLPSYCYDLNAMHEAEKILIQSPKEYSKRGYGAYIKYLTEIVDSSVVDILGLTHLSAHQRAEAFLKTIGKWEEA